MGAEVVKFRRPSRLECSACGASANASCDCGAEYVPAGTRAATAVAANLGKSNVAIAAEIGVSHETVRQARKKLTSNHLEVEKRIGRDGKARRLPSPRGARKIIDTPADPIQEPCADCQTPEQEWQRSLGNLAGDAVSMSAFWTRQFGKWEKFQVPSEMVTLAKQAAAAWAKLSAELNKRRS